MTTTFSTEIKNEICACERNIPDIINGFLYAAKGASYATQSETIADFLVSYLGCGITEASGVYSVRIRGSTDVSGGGGIADVYGGVAREIDSDETETASAMRVRAFLAGVFLACGVVANPESGRTGSQYRLDLNLNYADKCAFVARLTAKFNVAMNTALRRGKPLLYFKGGDKLADFLVLIGATDSALSVISTKIYKGISNDVNRASNCDYANSDKTARAAAYQLDNIELIMSGEGILPRDLLDVANMRRNNVGYTIREIAAELKISKTGVSRRFAAIQRLAESIRNQKGR
ncbi:hypothetical protein FACS1894133_5480 [Clostridia bacterium]|nr:hypothetical protein FACS1894133_5480 [Clostridia bacterium]